MGKSVHDGFESITGVPMEVSVARSRCPSNAGRVVALLLLLLLLGTMLSGCFAPRPPDTESTIRGVVVSVTPGREGGGIRVVWHESLGEMRELDSVDVAITEETGVFDREGRPIEFAEIEVRDVVDVWISGALAESYPPQGWADAVRVIGEFDEMRPLPMPPGLVEQ